MGSKEYEQLLARIKFKLKNFAAKDFATPMRHVKKKLREK